MGGGTLHNSGHGLALGHAIYTRCLGKYMYQHIMKETPNLKYHRDIYKDDKHSIVMCKCIYVAKCVRTAPLFMYPIYNSDFVISKTLTL